MKWLLPQPNNNSSNEHASAQKFDKTTGQIFTETTVPIQSFDDRNWARRSHMVPGVSYKDYRLETLSIKSFNNRGTDADLRNHQNDLDGRRKKSDLEGMKGARSLQEAAIECILQNISGVTLDGIQCLPSHIVRRVWGAVNARYVLVAHLMLHLTHRVQMYHVLQYLAHIFQNPPRIRWANYGSFQIPSNYHPAQISSTHIYECAYIKLLRFYHLIILDCFFLNTRPSQTVRSGQPRRSSYCQ